MAHQDCPDCHECEERILYIQKQLQKRNDHIILLEASAKGAASLLLDVQQDSVKAVSALAEIRDLDPGLWQTAQKIASDTLEEIIGGS